MFDPLELVGEAGTAVLWHGRLEHEGDSNLSERVRQAAIKRFFHEGGERFQAETPEEPFRGWEGLTGIGER
jgi:ectoine hydroxylase-related dioxygenase (phytanoyl-CoA dioxygenase family)